MHTAVASSSAKTAARPVRRAGPPTVDVVIPVLNEAATLADAVGRVRDRLAAMPAFDGRVVIADNGSTDGTLAVAAALVAAHSDVSVLHLAERGRGRALRAAWTRSTADVVAYMDVDLSTDLAALEPLLTLVTSGVADVAIGSRLAPGAHVERGPRREAISRSYNALLRLTLHVGFRDAQCGFKAIRGDVARALLPAVADDDWFFDTELLVRAEHDGYRVVELPVAWVDDPDSRVAILSTAWADLRGIARLRAERGVSIHPRRAGAAVDVGVHRVGWRRRAT